MKTEIEKFSVELKAERKIKTKSESIKFEEKDIPTFVDFLKNNLEKRKSDLSPTVIYNYFNHYYVKIKDYFGDKLLITDLTAERVQEFYDFLTGKGLSGSSVKHFACVLHPAFKEAYKNGYLEKNIIALLDLPKKEKYRGNYYDRNDFDKFFECIKGHDLELALKVASYYGLRRSELLGLRWDAIDFDKKTIHIGHKLVVVGKEKTFSDELKTSASCRTLPLMSLIESELKKQLERREENMKFLGNTYNHDYVEYVFTLPNGQMILPSHLTHSMDKLIKKHSLKKIRFHDLRHSCASLLLAEGVPMKQIQEWLGHASFKTTADIYSHLDYSTKIQSADKIANALGTHQGLNKPSVESKTIKDDKHGNVEELLKSANIPLDAVIRYIREKQRNDTVSAPNYNTYSNYRTKKSKEKEDDYFL